MDFSDLNLKPQILSALRDSNYVRPTTIQEKSIPDVLKGKDLIAIARTGTGKTAAFAVPILEKVNPHGDVQAVVLVPTRELCQQVVAEFKLIGKNLNTIVFALHGGEQMFAQEKELQKQAPQIVVATPSRLLEQVKRGNVYIREPKFLVLDEADRMLELGFAEEVERIIRIAFHSQKLLFSATMNEEIRTLAHKFLNEPVEILESVESFPDHVIQKLFVVQHSKKFDLLCTLLKSYSPESAIIFLRTRAEAELVAKKLQMLDIPARYFHGDLNQPMREKLLSEFKQGIFKYLVSSDVSARGLHLPLVSHVFNFSLPDDLTFYLHRIGRTARMNGKGTAITIVSGGQLEKVKEIERLFNTVIERTSLPDAFQHANFEARLNKMPEMQKLGKHDRKQRYRAIALKDWERQKHQNRYKKSMKKSRTYNSMLKQSRPGKKVTARMRMKGVRYK